MGGAYGHMKHPYEDLDLTFAELKLLVDKFSNTGVEISEKLDGQNLMVTVVDGEARFARNKSHIKNSAEKSLTSGDIFELYRNRPVQSAFFTAAFQIERMIHKVPQRKLDDLFHNGKRFMSVEILNPSSENVIPYNTYDIYVHNDGLYEYDEDGNVIDLHKHEAFRAYMTIISYLTNSPASFSSFKYQRKVQSDSNLNFIESYFAKRKINKIRDEFFLNDEDSLGQYVLLKWMKFLMKYPELTYNERHSLALKFSGLRSIRIDYILTDKEKTYNPAIKELSNESDKYNSMFLDELKTLFLKLGSKLVARSNRTILKRHEASSKIKEKLDTAINEIINGKNPSDIYLLRKNQKYLSGLPIPHSEGFIFDFKDSIYKLTGAFAPINQILGISRYKRS